MLPNEILPDLVLTSRMNKRWQYSGMDAPEHSLDQQAFHSYPYEVTYEFNSRGFRDTEWPQQEQDLKNCVWCLGDSFTVGLGQPFDHVWPQVLQNATNCRTINVSLDGGSNNWLARRLCDIQTRIDPKQIIVMWSFVERRESELSPAKQQVWEIWYADCKDASWPDCPAWDQLYLLPDYVRAEIRDVHKVPVDPEVTKFTLDGVDDHRRQTRRYETRTYEKYLIEDFENWCNCIDSVADFPNVLHCMIPGFAPADQTQKYIQYLHSKKLTTIGECKQLDFSRDGFHFDIITARTLVGQMVAALNINDMHKKESHYATR
jgi:hypothetical protein